MNVRSLGRLLLVVLFMFLQTEASFTHKVLCIHTDSGQAHLEKGHFINGEEEIHLDADQPALSGVLKTKIHTSETATQQLKDRNPNRTNLRVPSVYEVLSFKESPLKTVRLLI